MPIGFVDPTLGEHRPREKCGGLTGVGSDAQGLQPLQRGPEMRFGGDRVALHRFDDSREQLGLHQPVPQAEVGDDLAGVGQHRPGLVRPAPKQLQHREAAQRRRLERRCGRRHPLHPDHVETPAAGLRHRARPPQRRSRRRAQRRGDLSVVAALSRRDERLEEVGLAVTDPAEA